MFSKMVVICILVCNYYYITLKYNVYAVSINQHLHWNVEFQDFLHNYYSTVYLYRKWQVKVLEHLKSLSFCISCSEQLKQSGKHNLDKRRIHLPCPTKSIQFEPKVCDPCELKEFEDIFQCMKMQEFEYVRQINFKESDTGKRFSEILFFSTY